jgi:ubiquinone/menaquinone biosynthesis C-methylase UbiE
MQSKSHWENIYETKDATQVSWFQRHPELSFQFIERTGIEKAAHIIDVGGGASTLADDLLSNGYENVTVLDISAAALDVAQRRLGLLASKVNWLEADITSADLPTQYYDLWHDRAVFHFLTNPKDRANYVETVRRSVKAGGHVIVATFGLEGPLRCSGLEVIRYNPNGLHHEFGNDFELVDTTEELHQTPFGTEQQFVYCYCQKG